MDAPNPAPRARPRSWKRRLAFVGLGALALFAAAPSILGPLLSGVVKRELEDRLALEVRVGSLALAWPARVRLRGLELSEPGGSRVASLDELALDVRLTALLAGRLEGTLDLAYPELHVARDAEGRWNLQRTLERSRSSASRSSPPRDPRDVPEVHVRVRVSDGHLILHGPRGETALTDIEFALSIEDLSRPAPFHLGLSVRGPAGLAGSLDLNGSCTAASGGRLEPSTLAADVRLSLERIDLGAFAPALALVAPNEGLAGQLNGEVELVLAPGLALTGTSAFRIDGLTLVGPRAAGEPTRIERVELAGRATHDGAGAGTQSLELKADSILSMTYAGTSRLDSSGSGELAGTLELVAELGRSAEVAQDWVPFQPGVRLGGRAEAELDLTAHLVDGAPAQLGLTLSGGLADVSAVGPEGRALALGELQALEFALEATAEPARRRLSLARFDLTAGPLEAHAALEADGLGTTETLAGLRSGSFQVEADLDRLRGVLGSLVDLGERPFAGKLEAHGTLRGAEEGLDLALELQGSKLALAEASLTSGRGTLRAQRPQSGTLTAQGELTLGDLSFALAGRSPLEVAPARIELRASEAPDGSGELVLTLATEGGDARLALRAETRRADRLVEAEGTLELDGSAAALARLARPFVPLQGGLEGALRGRGSFRARSEDLALEDVRGRIELDCTDLGAVDATGVAHRLEALAQTSLSVEAHLDVGAGRAELDALRLGAGGLTLTASGRASGLPGAPVLEQGELALECDPERLGRELAAVVDLGGWTVAGQPLSIKVRGRAPAGRIEAEVHGATHGLRMVRPSGRPMEWADLSFDLDLGYDLGLGSLHLRDAELRSRALNLSLAGTLNELLVPARARGAMQLEASGGLAALANDLGLEAFAEGELSGRWRGDFLLEGDQGAFRVRGTSRIEDLVIRPPERSEGPALALEEPALDLTLVAQVGLDTLDIDLEQLRLESSLARGGAQGRIENLRGLGAEGARMEHLTGELAYVPDRLGVVLAPWLPGTLRGATEERVSFALDGPLQDLDLWTLLAGAQGRVDLGLGRFERPEIALGGRLSLEAKEGALLLRGDLQANGGTLQIDGNLALQDTGRGTRSRLALATKGVRASSGLAPLLSHLHPAFATVKEAQGSLEGLIDLTLDLTYDARLTPELLAGGFEALPKTPLNGTGRLALGSAALRGAPLLATLASFGVDVERTLDLRPIEFSIQKGRVSYAKPWTWTFADTETTFTGSLGLDQSLDLVWNVPIGPGLIERWPFLASLSGEVLALPLRGTVRAPRLESETLLKDLAAKVAKKELEGRLGLGGGEGEDPSQILARADQLWSRGEKVAAAALYVRLREDFKLSLAYALNKDRIKDRSKYTEPPKPK